MFILTTIAFYNTYPNAFLAEQALLFDLGNSLSDKGGTNKDKNKDTTKKISKY